MGSRTGDALTGSRNRLGQVSVVGYHHALLMSARGLEPTGDVPGREPRRDLLGRVIFEELLGYEEVKPEIRHDVTVDVMTGLVPVAHARARKRLEEVLGHREHPSTEERPPARPSRGEVI